MSRRSSRSHPTARQSRRGALAPRLVEELDLRARLEAFVFVLREYIPPFQRPYEQRTRHSSNRAILAAPSLEYRVRGN
jgi:hypothetical protein